MSGQRHAQHRVQSARGVAAGTKDDANGTVRAAAELFSRRALRQNESTKILHPRDPRVARCQSIVLNMWSVTLHNNRRIICSLFQRWGEEGLPLGAALSAVRGETAVKPRARFGTVLYGLPSLKYGS